MDGDSDDHAGRSFNYRDRIRAARAKVDAAAAESEKLAGAQQPASIAQRSRDGGNERQGHNAVTRRAEGAVAATAAAAAATQRQLQAPSGFSAAQPTYTQAPLRNQTNDMMSASSTAPQRPYRSDRNSWFAVASPGSPPQGDLSALLLSPASTVYGNRRNDITSYADTESIYSQTGNPNEQIGTFLTLSSHTSHHSNGSSLGEIPDFPVPDYIEDIPDALNPQSSLSLQTRNIPPSTRRATDSYYSHRSIISPIAEESPSTDPFRRSFLALSEKSLDRYEEYGHPDNQDDRQRRSFLQPFDEITSEPVRQASVGRAIKPSSVTVAKVKSVGGRTTINSNLLSLAGSEGGLLDSRQSAARASSNLVRDIDRETVIDDPLPPIPHSRTSLSGRSSTDKNSTMDPATGEIMSSLYKGGAIPAGMPTPGPNGSRGLRPMARPREDRVSTTSLSDLIRRATRVRTNLDRGKTASRIGLNDFFGRSAEKLTQYEKASDEPTPYVESQYTEEHSPEERPMADYFPGDLPAPEKKVISSSTKKSPSTKNSSKKRRRCCGIPQWLFVTLLVIFVICVAAAIIIPVELVVVPRQTADASSALPDLSSCPAHHACQNGANPVIYSSACSCACVNGFTGSTCQTAPSDACAADTSKVQPAGLGNITLGSSIPSVIQSDSGYGISLNTTAIVGAFSTNDLGCASQNELVTVSSTKKRRSVDGSSRQRKRLLATEPREPMQTPTATMDPARSLVIELRRQVTSAGLVFAGTPGASVPEQTPVPSSTGGASAPTSTATASNGVALEKYIEFSQAAILYILQTTDLHTAQTAQSSLSNMLSAPAFTPSVINVSNGVTIDLVKGIVTVPGSQTGNGNGIGM